MNDETRWVRPWFLSLVALFGLIVMVWGLISGAMGAFHIAQPKYGRAQSDQGDVAAAFRSVYSPLLSLGQSNGDVPPGSEEALARAETAAQQAALDRAKDQAYNDTVKGALAFVIGGLVLGIGGAGAKRAARGNGARTTVRSSPVMPNPGPAPRPSPAQPPRPATTARPTAPPPRPQSTPPPASRAVPVQPRPTQTTTSPVGALQEAPKRSARRAAPAAPRRPARKEPEAAPARPASQPPPPPPPPPAPAAETPPPRPAPAPTFRPPSAPPPTTEFKPPSAPGTGAPRTETPAEGGEEEPGT